jgi:hypothetical protein
MMEATFFCIYTGKNWPENERSKEHIVPYAVGGSNGFVTYDVSHEGNNKAGASADAEMINNFFVANERWQRHIASEDGSVPTIELAGTVQIDGRDVRAKFLLRPDGTKELITYPEVVSDWAGGHFKIACDPAQLSEIAANIEKKGKKRGLDFKVLEGLQASKSVQVEKPVMASALEFKVDTMARGFIKMALATAHHVLGYPWSKGSEAGQLRACLGESGDVDWEKHYIRGATWPCSALNDEMKGLFSAGPGRHVLAVLNLNPLSFSALLFGRYDATVLLHDGVWSQSGPAPGDGAVVVVDSGTRDVWQLPFKEFIARKTKGTLPWK